MYIYQTRKCAKKNKIKKKKIEGVIKSVNTFGFALYKYSTTGICLKGKYTMVEVILHCDSYF